MIRCFVSVAFSCDTLAGVKWTQYISYLKWGFQSLCIVEFSDQTFTCSPTDVTCVETGEEALELYSLDGFEAWAAALIVIGITTTFQLGFFLSLKFVSQKPQEQ